MLELKGKPDRYIVFGDPITQSKSPLIHEAFAKQTHQHLIYEKQQVNGESFNFAAKKFFSENGKGMNITAPCKLEAFAFAHSLTARAKRAGAVNTLIAQENGEILGDTTDGFGLVKDITQNLKWSLEGKRVLLLGAGGAVRGVLEPLLEQQPESLLIANRTAPKAQLLATDFAELCAPGTALSACGYEALLDQQFDVVINGTSASLSADLPPLPDTLLAPEACCYDMSYGAEPTVFMHWASQHGALKTADGLGMLVGQAAESFKLWRGVFPETGPVIKFLREKLAS